MSNSRPKFSRLQIGHAITALLAVTLLGALIFFLFASISLQSSSETVARTMDWSSWALPGLMLAAAGFAIWRRISYRPLVAVIVFASAVLIYLAWDDASRPPAPVVKPIVADNSPSYAAYRWLLKDDKGSRLTTEDSDLPALPPFPGAPSDWPGFVSEHREQFEQSWASDSLGREWVDALALHAPEAYFPPLGVKGPYLKFASIRRSCFARWGVAQLRRADGKADEAVSLLLPLAQAMYHVQAGSTTLVHQMIALVCLRGTYTRLDLLLTDPNLSAAKRREIVDTLQQAPTVATSVANAFLGERVIAHASMNGTEHDRSATFEVIKNLSTDIELPRGTWIVAPLLLNRNRAERDYLSFLDRVSAMNSHRGQRSKGVKF